MPLTQTEERLYYHNGVYMGDVIVGDDGYYYFWPENRGGCWSEGHMIEIAAHLRKLNAEWDIQVQTDPTIAGNMEKSR